MATKPTTANTKQRSAERSLRARLGRHGPFAGEVAAALLLALITVAWLVWGDDLQRRAAALTAQPTIVRFNWPVTQQPDGTPAAQTWLPAAVQRDLGNIASAQLSEDPFSQQSLENARRALIATGWFARIESVERDPRGHVDFKADWRIPVAVVQYRSREYVVAVGGEVLRLPMNTPVLSGSMPVITNPRSGPQIDELGVVYGVAWPGGDVQDAIDLLRHVRTIPEHRRITGVDLSTYEPEGHLTLITNAGSKVVWGSAPGDLGHGQVSADVRRARLRDILQTRFDESQRLIEIHTPVVMVDKTAAAQ